MGLAAQAIRFHADAIDFRVDEDLHRQNPEAWVLYYCWARDTDTHYRMSAEAARAALTDYEQVWAPTGEDRAQAERAVRTQLEDGL